jgi:hypothetical protein
MAVLRFEKVQALAVQKLTLRVAQRPRGAPRHRKVDSVCLPGAGCQGRIFLTSVQPKVSASANLTTRPGCFIIQMLTMIVK